jgi:hypothetical protein
MLGMVMVAASAVVLRFYDYDHDFIYNVWAPTRALLLETGPSVRSTRILAAGGMVLFGMACCFDQASANNW